MYLLYHIRIAHIIFISPSALKPLKPLPTNVFIFMPTVRYIIRISVYQKQYSV